jgi:hypothetical protein
LCAAHRGGSRIPVSGALRLRRREARPCARRRQPGGAFQATATIAWYITWQGAGGAGGVLPPLFTTTEAAFRVTESQALNTSGGT